MDELCVCPFCIFWPLFTSHRDFFVILQHVYVPLLLFSGVEYIDAPTPYMMGIHSGVDISGLTTDGVSLLFVPVMLVCLIAVFCNACILPNSCGYCLSLYLQSVG